jgi:hypothetical protein
VAHDTYQTIVSRLLLRALSAFGGLAAKRAEHLGQARVPLSLTLGASRSAEMAGSTPRPAGGPVGGVGHGGDHRQVWRMNGRVQAPQRLQRARLECPGKAMYSR